MNLKEMLKLVRDLAKKQGLTVEKYVDAVVSFDEATASEKSTREERIAVMDALRSIVETAPDASPRDVVVQVGLKQCQADRAFVRHYLTKWRSEKEAA